MEMTQEQKDRVWLRVQAAQIRRETKRREDREMMTTVGLLVVTAFVLVSGMLRRRR